jgi:hypothetical protein
MQLKPVLFVTGDYGFPLGLNSGAGDFGTQPTHGKALLWRQPLAGAFSSINYSSYTDRINDLFMMISYMNHVDMD